jgi:hypothetical protein
VYAQVVNQLPEYTPTHNAHALRVYSLINNNTEIKNPMENTNNKQKKKIDSEC